MPAEAYIKFFKKGFEGESLRKLRSDGLRWRWWRLCGLSDYETFPGLVSKGLAPLTEAEIIGLLYKSQEFNGRVDKITLWRQEKEALIASGLVRSYVLDGKEYLWNANFHSHQDKYSRKGAHSRESAIRGCPRNAIASGRYWPRFIIETEEVHAEAISRSARNPMAFCYESSFEGGARHGIQGLLA